METCYQHLRHCCYTLGKEIGSDFGLACRCTHAVYLVKQWRTDAAICSALFKGCSRSESWSTRYSPVSKHRCSYICSPQVQPRTISPSIQRRDSAPDQLRQNRRQSSPPGCT